MTARRSTAAALIVGNELLGGKVADENLVVLARALRAIGVRLLRAVMVPDDRQLIAAEVRALSEAHDWVFTSGGVGPTHDDLTIDAVADAFEVAVEPAPALEAMLRDYYRERITDGHLRMARAPAGARLLTGEKMPWPTVLMRNVWVLPGVPEIFAMKMDVVVAELGRDTPLSSAALYTTLDEGNLKPWLDRVVSEHPEVEIGSYPKWREPRYNTQITFDAADPDAVERARQALQALLPAEAVVELSEADPAGR